MTRADLVAYLNATFAEIVDALEFTGDDSVDGFRFPVDQALRKIGVTEANLATGTIEADDIEQAQALAEYHSLRRFLALAATRVDYRDANGTALRRSPVFVMIQDLLQLAEARIDGLGVTSNTSLDPFSIYLDYLEPADDNG